MMKTCSSCAWVHIYRPVVLGNKNGAIYYRLRHLAAQPRWLSNDLNLAYQIFTRFSGAIYMASPGFTSYVV